MKNDSVGNAQRSLIDTSSRSKPVLYQFGQNPDYMRERYSCLALVSHPRHFSKFDPFDDSILLVAHGWLLWQQAIAEGRHCVHYEAESINRADLDQRSDMFVKVNDWLYSDGPDPTEFRGVSLGARFSREISLINQEYDRLVRALETMIARYSPRQIIFVDFRAEHNLLDTKARLELVETVSDRHSIETIDASDPPDDDDPNLPFSADYKWRPPAKPKLKNTFINGLQSSLVTIWGIVGRLRLSINPTKPRILVASTQLTSMPLISAFDQSDFFACIYAPWLPNKLKWRWTFRNLIRGVVPINSSIPNLTKGDQARVLVIEQELTRLADRPKDDRFKLILEYAIKNIISTGRLGEMAREVKHIESLLNMLQPRMLLSDGLDYYLGHILYTVGRKLGIKTIATWHGQYIQDVKMSILGADSRVTSPIDWFFTWGIANEKWLDNMGSPVGQIRTGNPLAVSAGYQAMEPDQVKRILLLQFVPTGEDHLCPQAMQYDFTVNLVRKLFESGEYEIQLKIHPGPYNQAYYATIADYYDLDINIRKDEPFSESLAWADIAIGPAVSAAMIEVLGAGKPYFPVVFKHSAVNRDYLADSSFYEDVDEIAEAVKSEHFPDFGALIENHAALGEIPNPARRTWEVVSNLMSTAEE